MSEAKTTCENCEREIKVEEIRKISLVDYQGYLLDEESGCTECLPLCGAKKDSLDV